MRQTFARPWLPARLPAEPVVPTPISRSARHYRSHAKPSTRYSSEPGDIKWVKKDERKAVFLVWKGDSSRAINWIRFDPPPTLPSEASIPPPPPRTPYQKKVPSLRKSSRCFYFGHLITSSCFVAFLLSLLLVSLLLVFFWPGQVPVQNCSRKSQGLSEILRN